MISVLMVSILVLGLVFVLLSPLESLRWWSRLDADQAKDLLALPPRLPQPVARHSRFVVYLSGIGAIDGSRNSGRETHVLSRIAESLPHVEIVADVFPYAMENRGLLQRTTTWLWRRLDKGRRSRNPASVLHYLINVRNFLQMLVSSDSRYGPTYNLGLAQEILRSLVRHGWDPQQPVPVTIIGYSGGAQIATGAAFYLGARGIDVSIISIGGVFSDDPGLDEVRDFHHLYGARDTLQRLGGVLFPGRWSTAPVSSYGRAIRDGRFSRRCIGQMQHNGRNSYFDHRALDDEGRSYQESTIEAVTGVLRSLDG